MDLTIQHRESGGEGEWYIDHDGERIAEMSYRRGEHGKTLVVHHTWVSDTLRGHGVARKLLDEAVAYARGHGMKILPTCPYAKAQFEKDPSIHDVLAAS